ncbi:threonine ammonia-lyase [Woeseia oceani]|uniref:Serine/threonine dehydratase n=1 Tax=Woeseia oceani TaxID=1548547 RepID=A0A193LG13_9GAMM|nr:threonine/serine dehydratase [Woeseia oceani]ANO51447.1 serine/threonine dehydratase [Woeseia oceani]
MLAPSPGLAEIRALRLVLARWLVNTPVVRCPALEAVTAAPVHAKLEFLQRTSTFKPRGALAVMLELDDRQRAAGVVAVSAGNHAIATAYAASELGISAKVVMPDSSSPARVERCRHYGAEILTAADAHQAFALAERIVREEGRYLVHPFEGPRTSLGTATLGMEICEQVGQFDAVIVPIGGGGLCSGIATAVKLMRPGVQVYGVEPVGADTMHRSFAKGSPQAIDKVNTIADSLGAPFALPYSYALCRAHTDRLVRVSDGELRNAMRFLFHEVKLAVEAACAASTAALLGPLLETVRGRPVVIVMCGSNIDWAMYERHAELETG